MYRKLWNLQNEKHLRPVSNMTAEKHVAYSVHDQHQQLHRQPAQAAYNELLTNIAVKQHNSTCLQK